VRIVLDTTILVRANESSQGLARQLLLDIVAGRHALLLSSEILYELARVLRYPRMQALHGLPESRIYDYIGFLREVSELVTLNPLLSIPIRDVNDIVTVQTPMVVDFGEGGGWALAGAGDGSEPQSVNSREGAAAEACRSASQ
jgi:putative PIN family toxin of toxin-antitoxin system